MAIKNLKRFNKQVEKFAEKAGINVALVTKNIAFKAFESVIDKTPVDTGWAIASWRFSEGNIDPTVAKKPKKGSKALESTKLQFDSINNVKFPTYYITNNLDYIKYLEAGTAEYVKPDSGHMVERTENLLKQYVKDALRVIS